MPNDNILKKYAELLINFALWSGKGVKKGDVVMLSVPESAKAILIHLQQAVLKAGAHPMIHFIPEGLSRLYFENASVEQLKWQPEDYLLERVKTGTHFVSIISTNDKFELKGVDSSKIMTAQKAIKFYIDARNKKENEKSPAFLKGGAFIIFFQKSLFKLYFSSSGFKFCFCSFCIFFLSIY